MIPSKTKSGPAPTRTDFWTRRVSELRVAVGQADFEWALQQSPGPDALPAVVQALDRSTLLAPNERQAAVLAVLAYYGADRPDLIARARAGRFYVEIERASPSPRLCLAGGLVAGAACLAGARLLAARSRRRLLDEVRRTARPGG